MAGTNYRRALESAVKEYERLKAQRDAVETRLAQLRQTIASLGALCDLPSAHSPGPEPALSVVEGLGLTDACRSTLRASLSGLTALQVRDRLAAFGIDPGRYANPLASIHIVLKRLVAAGEAASYRGRDGKPVYVWKRAAIPFAVSDPAHATAIVTGGVMWPDVPGLSVKPARGPKKPKKEK